eukprot:GFKZ01012422.1.p1 GENE.GFKZ01012422.1~~GFKZ01012422.1.p1  ORF type:complete len:386 (+),score=40.64 GFKZ01012422.1:131-1159(+)
MPHVETLLPRPALFNTALYALPALVYTATLFTLEMLRPFQYVFAPQSPWRDRFAYLAIISWPILVFGALILVAVRIGARARRRSSKRSKRTSSGKKLSPPVPPSTAVPRTPPRALLPLYNDPSQVTVEAEGMEGMVDPEPEVTDSRRGSMLRRRRRRRRRRLPRGYVSVTTAQRLFAGFGFLWVAVGMVSTGGCAVFVFFGQRERNAVDSGLSGVVDEDIWKTIVVPVLTGIVPALVFLGMTIASLFRFKGVVRAKGKLISTPMGSEAGDEERSGHVDVQVVFDNAYGPLPVRPDDDIVTVLLDELRRAGFANEHENLAALQAASYDVQVAKEKLANARTSM